MSAPARAATGAPDARAAAGRAPGRRPASTQARLARLGFSRPAEAEASLGRLNLLAGLGFADDRPAEWAVPADGDAAVVVEALAAVADPSLALRQLDRLALADPHPDDLLCAVRGHDGLRRRLLAVLGASSALGDHLVAQPDLWMALVAEPVFTSAYDLRRELLAAVGADPDDPLPWGSGGSTARDAGDATLVALRLAYRGALLRIAVRDLTTHADVSQTTSELADLAAAALDAGLAVAAAGLPAGSVPCRLAVVAMGKCGGRELNYCSDVDVVFVAEPLESRDGVGGDPEAALRTATLLASSLMDVCGRPTPVGNLFPVDPNLRPEGRNGPLVRTLASHLAYYQRWARTWEFQALLKARPVAGDLRLGGQYVEEVAPLVWSAGEREHFVDDVQAMRRRVEANIPRAELEREVKLGPGGLRDIEFSVQLLQLVHGRTDRTLRSPTTLDALEALVAGGYVGREDGVQLDGAYRFLRDVEHRLQLQHLRRTHTVPNDPAALRWLGRSLGFADGVAFEQERLRRATEVRRLHEKLFYRPLLASVVRLPVEEAGLRMGPAAAKTWLTALGFADATAALRHLETLSGGLSRRASIQRTLLPVMLGWFAQSADPDAGLLAFRHISDRLGSTPWYLRSLRDDGPTAERLAALLGGSRLLSDLVGRAPEALRSLGDDAALTPHDLDDFGPEILAIVGRTEDAQRAVAAVRGVRRRELLRIGSGYLLGLTPHPALAPALSDVATATIAGALAAAERTVLAEWRTPRLPMTLAVIGMGRLGGREQGFSSDADVVLVHEARSVTPGGPVSESEGARAAHAVVEEMRRLLALPAADPPLVLDADLRPEGRQGPLTRSLASYERYIGTRLQTWEAQALLRAVPLVGSAELAERFCALIAPVRYPTEFTGVDEVRRMKKRVETERVSSQVIPSMRWRDVKLGPGGLADVEWTVQLLQLVHGARVPALQTPSTLGALDAALGAGLLAAADATVLRDAWRRAARLRDAVVLVSGRILDVVPTSGRPLAGVARLAGQVATDDPEDVLLAWRDQAAECREVCVRLRAEV